MNPSKRSMELAKKLLPFVQTAPSNEEAIQVMAVACDLSVLDGRADQLELDLKFMSYSVGKERILALQAETSELKKNLLPQIAKDS